MYILHKTSQYFSKPNENYSTNIKVELNLSTYATKADLKGGAGFDTSKLADCVTLKAEVDKIDADKLKFVPVYLSNLSNVVDNDVFLKKCFKIFLKKLVPKVNAFE